MSRVQAAGGHVLIIEDEPVIALELELLLTDLGFGSFDIADTPEDALARARERRPDLITADYRITGGTGVAAIEMITTAIGEPRVIYVTGNAGQFDPGAHAVVDKPILASALARACALTFRN
ncbi:response regulator [Phenylobacterium sp.]|uniref:response regulator n=1 Tax=Phenylobacterium sp. TaxID=1871053 RepID=UPI003D2C8B54